MSGFLFPDDDRQVGCCSCLGFFKKGSRDSDSFFDDREFLPDDADGSQDDSYGRNGCDGNGKLVPLLPGRDRLICREKPVKETTILLQTRDASGRKMINEYAREHTIGCGSYGKVVLYRSSIDGNYYAIKAFYKSRLSRVRVNANETAMTDVLREVSIMKLINHPNIINLIEVIDDPESDNFYMVLEYVESKAICATSGTAGGIGEAKSRSYLRDIVAGLIYLHSHGIIHGDIKPENLLVTGNGAVKIGDFGVSHVFEDDNDELFRSPGTPVFTAPECCLGSRYHGKAADTWAVGVTLFCMVLGYCPFIGDSLQDTYDKIVYSPLRLPKKIDPQLKDLLHGILCKDPEKRMKLDAIANHPWVVRDQGPIPETSCRCGKSQIQNQLGRRDDTNNDFGASKKKETNPLRLILEFCLCCQK